MAQPGWYPDPGGSDKQRFWDGHQWGDLANEPTNRKSGRSGIAFGVVAVLAVGLIVGLLIWQPWSSIAGSTPTDDNTAKPTGSQWNELEPTETPTDPQPTDEGGRPEACPYVGDIDNQPVAGWYLAGGMGFKEVDGWDTNGGWVIDFAAEPSGQTDNVTGTWVANVAIGLLDKEDFTEDSSVAAQRITDCMATSYYYPDLQSRDILSDEEFTTGDGVPGWRLTSNFWNPGPEDIQGDEVTVVVADPGLADQLVLFVSATPIGDAERAALVKAALDSFGLR